MAIGKSSFLFAIGTFLSRLTGVLRESVLAGVFGANSMLDAFIIANRIPNLLRELLAEGALGSSFTQVYAKLKERDSHRAELFLSQSFRFFSLVTGIICFLGIIFAPQLVKLMTLFSTESDRHPEFIHDTVGLTRLLFPFIAFMTLGAIASGVLHQKGKFFTSAISSVALNVGYILGALIFAGLLEDYGPSWIETSFANKSLCGLCLGVLLGGVLQTLIQYWGMRERFHHERKLFQVPWSQDLKKVCKLMGPMIIAGSAGQINVLVNTNFATSLQAGAVTWLNFSFRILQLPIGIFAVGVGVISLPALTKVMANQGGPTKVAEKLQEALSLVSWLVVPCLCFLLFNSLPATQLLYEHGKFTNVDSSSTADALFFYSFSLIAYGLLKVLTSYYYAAERTNYAMKVSLFSIIVNVLANSFFIHSLGHKGLALSTSCTLSLNAIFLIWGLKKDRLKWNMKKAAQTFFLITAAFILALILQYGTNSFLMGLNWLGDFSLKIRSLVYLSCNGLLVLLIFSSAWMIDRIRAK